MYPFIYLASSSPRRAKLLSQIGVNFEILSQNIDETHFKGESAQKFATRLAKEKSVYGLSLLNKTSNNQALAPILGADTIISIGNKILGKPQSKQDAISMLNLLSGQTHQVMTAITICNEKKIISRLSTSDVTFCKLTQQEIISYCQSTEPLDKAGAYAIQGKAATFIKEINGSYSGVMGLPLYETAQLLKEFSTDI